MPPPASAPAASLPPAPRHFVAGLAAGVLIASAALLSVGVRLGPPGSSAPAAASSASWFGFGGGGGGSGGGSSAAADSAAAAAAVTACAAQTFTNLRALRDRVQRPGVPTEGCPLLMDMAHGADACRTVPGAISPAYVPADVCYVVAAPGDDSAHPYVRILNATWFSFVPYGNVVVVAKRDNPDYRMRSFPELSTNPTDDAWIMEKDALRVIFFEPQFAHCKWWVSSTFQDWVNPSAVLNLVRGFHDEHPLVFGFIWHEMGWSHGVTYAGPQAVYSRAAVRGALAKMADPAGCGNRTGAWGTMDDFAMDACLWAADAVHVHSNLFEPIGELGPGNSWSWQQPHNLLSWVAVRNNLNPARAFGLFGLYYINAYGDTNDWPGRKGFGLLHDLPPRAPIP